MSKIRDMAGVMARSGALQRKIKRPPEMPSGPITPIPHTWERPPEPQLDRIERKIEEPMDTESERASKFGPKNKQRYTILGISVSHEEKNALRSVMRKKGYKNFSQWAREALFQAAGLPIPPRREPAYEKKPKKRSRKKSG